MTLYRVYFRKIHLHYKDIEADSPRLAEQVLREEFRKEEGAVFDSIKEAATFLEVDSEQTHEVEVVSRIDWNKALEGLDEEAKRKVFDNITRQLDQAREDNNAKHGEKKREQIDKDPPPFLKSIAPRVNPGAAKG